MTWIDLDWLNMIDDMYLLLINVLQLHTGIIEIDEYLRHFQEFAEEVVLAHTFQEVSQICSMHRCSGYLGIKILLGRFYY